MSTVIRYPPNVDAPSSLTAGGGRRQRRAILLPLTAEADDVKGAGGTAGGVVPFFAGLAMAVGGAYLLTNQVTVSTGFWGFFGAHTFGLSLLPLVVGSGFLFFDGKSVLGWLLTLGGALLIFLGILMNLRVYFEPTSLFNTVVMLVLLAGGLGLIARSLKPSGDGSR
jgi:hypothetical protein